MNPLLAIVSTTTAKIALPLIGDDWSRKFPRLIVDVSLWVGFYGNRKLSTGPQRKRRTMMPRGPKGEKRPADAIRNAVMIAKIATGLRISNPPA